MKVSPRPPACDHVVSSARSAARYGPVFCLDLTREFTMPGPCALLPVRDGAGVGHARACARVTEIGRCPGLVSRVCTGYARAGRGGRGVWLLCSGCCPGGVVGFVERAAARAANDTKKWRQGDFRPPTVRLATPPQYGCRTRVFVRCLSNSNQTCTRRASYYSCHTILAPICGLGLE